MRQWGVGGCAEQYESSSIELLEYRATGGYGFPIRCGGIDRMTMLTWAVQIDSKCVYYEARGDRLADNERSIRRPPACADRVALDSQMLDMP